MINEATTPIVVEIAKNFISLVRDVAPTWSKGYLRFCARDSMSEAKGSYVLGSDVEIIAVSKHSEFFDIAISKGEELLAALGKSEGLFLLIANSNLDYEIKFEYSDLGKWRISKMKGGTGIPEGLE